jgi:hypothetical protein
MLYTIPNLAEAIRSVSRPVIMWHTTGSPPNTAPDLWEPELGLPLTLEHAGDTEGALTVSFETERSNLLVPELFGNVPLKSFITSETPSITGVNVWVADPDIAKKWSPTAVAHGGRSRRAEDQGRTMRIIPEDLFIAADGQTQVGLIYEDNDFMQQPLAADGVTPSGAPVAVPAAKEHLIGNIITLWRVGVDRADKVYQHEDGSRSLAAVGIIPMIHPNMPNGHHVFTMGNPFDYGIETGGGDS